LTLARPRENLVGEEQAKATVKSCRTISGLIGQDIFEFSPSCTQCANPIEQSKVRRLGDMAAHPKISPADDLLNALGHGRFGTILCDPPWQFQNRTGKIAPEHKRLSRRVCSNVDPLPEEA